MGPSVLGPQIRAGAESLVDNYRLNWPISWTLLRPFEETKKYALPYMDFLSVLALSPRPSAIVILLDLLLSISRSTSLCFCVFPYTEAYTEPRQLSFKPALPSVRRNEEIRIPL